MRPSDPEDVEAAVFLTQPRLAQLIAGPGKLEALIFEIDGDEAQATRLFDTPGLSDPPLVTPSHRG